MPKAKKKKTTKKQNEVKPEAKKPSTFEFFDDLLLSDYATKDKLFRLVDLCNLSYMVDESKENLVTKLLYEGAMGLDEIVDNMWDKNELQEICRKMDLDIKYKEKNNLIGIIIKKLPSRKKRKIRTIIEEAVEEDLGKLRIYNIFIIYPDGRSLFSYNLEAIQIGDSSMITSALNAISHLLKEITKSKERLDSIDIGERELLFDYGLTDLGPGKWKKGEWNLVAVMLVNRESKEAKALLKEFLYRFEEEYKDRLLPRFDGCIDYFKSGDKIIQEVFAEYLDL